MKFDIIYIYYTVFFRTTRGHRKPIRLNGHIYWARDARRRTYRCLTSISAYHTLCGGRADKSPTFLAMRAESLKFTKLYSYMCTPSPRRDVLSNTVRRRALYRVYGLDSARCSKDTLGDGVVLAQSSIAQTRPSALDSQITVISRAQGICESFYFLRISDVPWQRFIRRRVKSVRVNRVRAHPALVESIWLYGAYVDGHSLIGDATRAWWRRLWRSS